MRRPLLCALALLLLPGLVVAGRKKRGAEPPAPPAVGPTVVPASNIFLRTAFDTDPSTYIGRFLPDGLELVDESNAARTRCSEHISYREVGGGNVVYDELFNASTEAGLRVGLPQVFGVGVGGASSRAVRITYALSTKLVAELEDPAAFEACCQQAPDLCSSRYVAEFYEGTGAVYHGLGREAEVDISALAQGVAAEVELAHGMAWERSVEFSEPVYFAMKIAPNPYTGQALTERAAATGPTSLRAAAWGSSSWGSRTRTSPSGPPATTPCSAPACRRCAGWASRSTPAAPAPSLAWVTPPTSPPPWSSRASSRPPLRVWPAW